MIRETLFSRVLFGTIAIASFTAGLVVAAHSADLNLDGKTNMGDLVFIKTQWGGAGGSPNADLDHSGQVQAPDAGILLSTWEDRPNPARFYFKWSAVDFDDVPKKDKIAKYNDLMFDVEWGPNPKDREVLEDFKTRRVAQGNPGMKLIRYYNMWGAFPAQLRDLRDNGFLDTMYLYRDWPAPTGPKLIHRENGRCTAPDLLNIASPEFLAVSAAAIRSFVGEMDGMYFDISAWDIYLRRGQGMLVNPDDPSDCPDPPDGSGYSNFQQQSRDFAVSFHKFLQESAIDPAQNNSKIHICNGIALGRKEWEDNGGDTYLARYLDEAKVDGCQMDGSLVNQQDGSIDTGKNWKHTLDIMAKFLTHTPKKYFLQKSPGKADNIIEYTFATHLLGTDGQYAMFWPATYIDWDTDKYMSAPLGGFAGSLEWIGDAETDFTARRLFANGVVAVNGDNEALNHTVPLPTGKYRDVRRSTCHNGSISIPNGQARLLIKDETC